MVYAAHLFSVQLHHRVHVAAVLGSWRAECQGPPPPLKLQATGASKTGGTGATTAISAAGAAGGGARGSGASGAGAAGAGAIDTGAARAIGARAAMARGASASAFTISACQVNRYRQAWVVDGSRWVSAISEQSRRS